MQKRSASRARFSTVKEESVRLPTTLSNQKRSMTDISQKIVVKSPLTKRDSPHPSIAAKSILATTFTAIIPS